MNLLIIIYFYYPLHHSWCHSCQSHPSGGVSCSQLSHPVLSQLIGSSHLFGWVDGSTGCSSSHGVESASFIGSSSSHGVEPQSSSSFFFQPNDNPTAKSLLEVWTELVPSPSFSKSCH